MQDTERTVTVVAELDDQKTVRIPAVAPPRLASGTRELEPLRPTPLGLDDVAEVAHDLKSPINTIMLEVWMLEDRARGELPVRELRDALARMSHHLIHLDRVVQDLADVCAAETGPLVLRKRLVDVRQLVESVVARSVTARDQHRISLTPGDAIILRIDDLRIERVIANLVSNALQFSPAKASVLVQLEVLAMVVRVSVVDAGTRDRATDGLGLQASRRIVEAHGGWLGVEAMPDVGTRYYIDLPAGQGC